MTVDPGTLAAVATRLREARSIVVGSHVDPDGDAIGSMLGLAAALDRAGIPCLAVLPQGDTPPATYAFLPGTDRLVSAAGVPAPEVFVALDSPDLARLGDAEPLARAAHTLVVIDHHPDCAIATDLALVDRDAPASGALVWDLLPHLGVVPDVSIATCLYAALLSDTGRFSYSNTSPAALRAAAAMIEAGAHPNEIYTAIYETRSPGAQALIGRTLERITLANAGAVAYSWVDAIDFAETGALPEESENLIDHVRTLRGVRVVFLAKINGSTVRVSLRAKGDEDVGAIARAFGGGGHRAAAGFTYTGDLASLAGALLPMLPGHAP